jgi:hypothetical protein
MKKVLLAIVLIFLSVTTHAFAATISIPDTNADAGGEVVIPINIDNAKGIAGFEFTITYDASALKAIGAVAGELTSRWMITPNTTESGQIKVAGLDTSLTGLSGVSGTLVKLQFKVLGKPGKKSSLEFTVCKLSDSKGTKIVSTCKPGEIRMKSSGKEK